MKKRVLITGHKGYIGQHLWKLIQDTRPDIELTGIDNRSGGAEYGNINSNNNRAWPLFYIKYDAVIHLAALVRVGESVNDPIGYYETNVNGTLKMLGVLDSYETNFIFASTGAAQDPVSPYALSKRMAETLVKQKVKFYHNTSDYTIFRFYNVIGTEGFPPTNPEGLMLNLMKAKETGKFNLFGNDYNTKDGTCVREYVHVMDICRAIVKAIDKPANGIENLAYGDPRTTKEIVDIFTKVNEVDLMIDYAPRRKGDLEACYLKNPSPYMERNYTYEQMLKI
jgi:UDP-glucose 4-epimerase